MAPIVPHQYARKIFLFIIFLNCTARVQNSRPFEGLKLFLMTLHSYKIRILLASNGNRVPILLSPWLKACRLTILGLHTSIVGLTIPFF